MGFREKMAWAMLVIMSAMGGLYFYWVFQQSAAIGDWAPPNLRFLIGFVILVIVLAIIAGTVIGISRPSEASPPMDERERMISYSGEVWAGRLMTILILFALGDFAVNDSGNRLFHLTFASLVVSQIAEHVMQILFYRRGV
ncbi:MAG: hypothetical protein NXH78_05785 [Hyphomonadaceae bacterium]|nr:hypothetical protein [Hyphomonadaceae bacterium]